MAPSNSGTRVVESVCASCRGRGTLDGGNLCAGCRASLRALVALCPSQIVASTQRGGAAGAALIDAWGCARYLPARALLGRRPLDCHVAILHGAVSRHHALLERRPDGWCITDLESHNGTWVNGTRIVGTVALTDRARLCVGPVELLFAIDRGDLRDDTSTEGLEELEPTRPTILLEAPSAGSSVDAVLVEATSGGGYLGLGERWLALSSGQVALLQRLATQWDVEHDSAQGRRGFVTVTDLLDVIPWDSPRLAPTNLRQLVARTRSALSALALDDRLESRRGLGYRLVGGLTRPS